MKEISRLHNNKPVSVTAGALTGINLAVEHGNVAERPVGFLEYFLCYCSDSSEMSGSSEI